MSPNIKGALFILAAGVLFSTMGALAKLAGARLHAFEVAFGRAFFGLIILAPFIWRAGIGTFKSAHPVRLITRGIIGSTGMLLGFYAITNLTLAEATALSFTKPLFMVVLAALILHETVRARRWSATAIGFLGVLVMMRPGFVPIETAAIAALLGACCGATVSILIKQLMATETRGTILLYLGLAGLVVTLPFALPFWLWPTVHELLLLAAIAGVGQLSQLCLMQGFKLGEASALAPFEYARLPIAAAYGFWLFDEAMDLWTLVGALIIVGATIYIARREAQLGYLERDPLPHGTDYPPTPYLNQADPGKPQEDEHR